MLVSLPIIFWYVSSCQCQFLDKLATYRFPVGTGTENLKQSCSAFLGYNYAKVEGKIMLGYPDLEKPA